MYIFESSKEYKVEFSYDGELLIFPGKNIKDTVGPILDWLYSKGYSFTGSLHNSFTKKLLTIDDIKSNPRSDYYLSKMRLFYQLKGTDKYIAIGSNIQPVLSFIKKMLVNFGIDESTINFEGFDTQTTSEESDDFDIDDFESEDSEGVTPMRSLMLQDFWTKFKSEVSSVTNLYVRRLATSKDHWFGAATGINGVGYFCVVSSRYARVELYISKSSKEDNKIIFDYLFGKKDDLESSFGEKLIFERLDSKKASRIKFEIPSNVYDKNNWDSIMNFFKLYLPKFESAFQPVIDEIKNNPSILNSSNISSTSSSEEKMTFVKAAQVILKDNSNRPMTSSEIWSQIEEQELVETSGLTPQASLNSKMILYSINSNVIGKKKNSIFEIIEGTKPYKFILLNPNEVQEVPEEDNAELEPEDYVKNPFGCKQEDGKETSAICILGESGAGKSFRVRKTLQNAEHKYIIVSPTSATTNLLVQYDRGDYVLSTLGEFIKRAVEDPNSYYTAILDEGHKYIKMIDDELLQCLSSKRNDGVRFISFDNPIFKRLYDFLETDDDFGGVGLIPDNLGFILISSKRDAILNADIRNRISVINLDKSHHDIEFAIDKLKELIEDSEDDGYSNE